jgi:hypothetical protein
LRPMGAVECPDSAVERALWRKPGLGGDDLFTDLGLYKGV